MAAIRIRFTLTLKNWEMGPSFQQDDEATEMDPARVSIFERISTIMHVMNTWLLRELWVQLRYNDTLIWLLCIWQTLIFFFLLLWVHFMPFSQKWHPIQNEVFPYYGLDFILFKKKIYLIGYHFLKFHMHFSINKTVHLVSLFLNKNKLIQNIVYL